MEKRYRILVVDDEQNIRLVLQEILEQEGCIVDQACDGEEALVFVRDKVYDLILLDIKMPRRDGISTLREIRKIYPDALVLMITAYDSHDVALQCIGEGAYDFLVKTSELDEFRIVIRRALEKHKLLQEIKCLRMQVDESVRFEQIVGNSPSMEKVFSLIRKVAASDATVLITGPSGTGKELAANAIHYNSPRRNKPFVKVNCVAIPETLLESELFGHEKGAFTGAIQRHIGKFEQAQGGTIFLDEIGDISPSIQAKLLRVIQERTFERVGGTKPIEVDIRIIAATNHDLAQLVQDGEFREDLYFRLNVINITMPALKDRPTDIPALVNHFIKYYNPKLNKSIKGLSKGAERLLVNYSWPGNVRELENVIQRAMILADSDIIVEEDLEGQLQKPAASPLDGLDSFLDADGPLQERLQRVQDWLESQIIERTLKRVNYHRTEAARVLGVSRKTLHNKINKYGLLNKS